MAATPQYEKARRRRPVDLRKFNVSVGSLVAKGVYDYAEGVRSRGNMARCMKRRKKNAVGGI